MLHQFQRNFIRSVTALLLLFSFHAAAQAQGQDLVQMLTSQLGVSGEQATGGAGAVLGYALENVFGYFFV